MGIGASAEVGERDAADGNDTWGCTSGACRGSERVPHVPRSSWRNSKRRLSQWTACEMAWDNEVGSGKLKRRFLTLL